MCLGVSCALLTILSVLLQERLVRKKLIDAKSKISTKISTRTTFKRLSFLIVGLLILSAIFTSSVRYLPDYPLRDMLKDIFDVNEEMSLPTFYSVYALQVCALLLGIIAHLTKVRRERYFRHWQILSFTFVYLSFDEALTLHERPTEMIRESLNTSGFLYFAWVIPAAVLVAVFLLGYLKFLSALPIKIRSLFLIAGGIFVLGALGIEMVGSKIATMGLLDSTLYTLVSNCEEFLEMLGVLVFMYALLSFLRMKLSSVEISLVD